MYTYVRTCVLSCLGRGAANKFGFVSLAPGITSQGLSFLLISWLQGFQNHASPSPLNLNPVEERPMLRILRKPSLFFPEPRNTSALHPVMLVNFLQVHPFAEGASLPHPSVMSQESSVLAPSSVCLRSPHCPHVATNAKASRLTRLAASSSGLTSLLVLWTWLCFSHLIFSSAGWGSEGFWLRTLPSSHRGSGGAQW